MHPALRGGCDRQVLAWSAALSHLATNVGLAHCSFPALLQLGYVELTIENLFLEPVNENRTAVMPQYIPHPARKGCFHNAQP